MPVFSPLGLVAVIKSVSGRSNTSGRNLSKVALMLTSNRRYSPHWATFMASGKCTCLAMSSSLSPKAGSTSSANRLANEITLGTSAGSSNRALAHGLFCVESSNSPSCTASCNKAIAAERFLVSNSAEPAIRALVFGAFGRALRSANLARASEMLMPSTGCLTVNESWYSASLSAAKFLESLAS